MANLQYFDTDTITLQSGATIARFLRVKITTGKLALAGATDRALGNVDRSLVADEYGPVRLRTAPTSIYITDATIAAGGTVYGAANGEVGSDAGAGANDIVGIALTASGGTANEQILVAH